MRIGKLASAVGLRTSAIRYYEEIGLLEPATRVSGRREYDQEALDTLRLIQAAQQAGLTLDEIRKLRAPKGACSDLLHAKIEQIDQSIERLREARATLVGALGCECAGVAKSCMLVDRSNGGRSDASPTAPARRSRTSA